MIKQSRFNRSLINEAKLGAYYTDLEHCRRIGLLFQWPEDEVCVLEPSIGDGSAVSTVMQNCSRKKIFGVEMNPKTCQEMNRKNISYLINADFLDGVQISMKAFSFCFSNPPYGEDRNHGGRYEKNFMENIYRYMMPGGVFVFVIPYYVLTERKFLKAYLSRFQPLRTYRFDEREYVKFKQVVVIAKRRNTIALNRTWLEQYEKMIEVVEKLPYLPMEEDEVSEKIVVNSCYEKNIDFFTTREFNAADAVFHLEHSPLYALLQRKAFPKEYLVTEMGKPPLPPKKDLLYLCAVSGGGQGLVGDTSTGDLHLQRGVVKKEVENTMVIGKKEVVSTEYSKVSLNIIENDGSITVLS